MAELGAHPRLAAMMLAATGPDEAALAADLAALLEERDPLRAGPDAPADIALRLAAIADRDPAADRGALGRIRRAAGQYRRRLGLPQNAVASGDPGRLVATGFPDRVAQLRGEPGSFRLADGSGARLGRTDRLANIKLLAVAALDLKASARIRLAAPLDPDALPPALAARVTETVEAGFDPMAGAVLSRRRRRLGALILSDRTETAAPAAIAATLATAAASDGLRALPWTDGARQFQSRVGLMRSLEPETWPDLSDAALVATVSDWLEPYLGGMARLTDLARLDLPAMLRGLVPPFLTARLDQELPASLHLPGGRAAVDYTEPVPIAAARAQAFFGLATTPQLARGRIPLRLALLSPAGRPAAITGDIARFWREAWADVRKDMRGRYPKHRWPENGSES